jgi:hypothetical protein
MVAIRPKRFRASGISRTRDPGSKLTQMETVKLLCIVGVISALCSQKYTLYTPSGRIASAWRDTPTKWYPLPVAIGALLLVAIRYKKSLKEVYVDENGQEIIRLRGPWQVGLPYGRLFRTSPDISDRYMY